MSAERWSVFLLESLERGEAVLDVLKALRRGIDPGRVGTEEEREVLELGLHPVLRLEIRREPDVDASQVVQALPHGREGRQGRTFALVEGVVGVGAEALELVGVG